MWFLVSLLKPLLLQTAAGYILKSHKKQNVLKIAGDQAGPPSSVILLGSSI